MRKIPIAVVFLVAVAAFGQKLTVKIVNRENNETDYTYIVPGHST